MRRLLIILAALASMLAPLAVAWAAGRCPVTPFGHCVELSGVPLREPDRLARYAVRNLTAMQAETTHSWFVAGSSGYERAFYALIPAAATSVFTITADVPYGSVGDVMVQASQQITIELLSPVYVVYAPAVMRPVIVPTPAPVPTPSPQPPGSIPWCPGSTGTTRVGAICKDGSSSSATGSGACSRHGGVSCWIGR